MEKFIFLFLTTYTLCYGHELKGFEDTILYKIDWPGDVDKVIDTNKYEALEVTTRENEKYSCLIPVMTRKEEQKQSVDTDISPLSFITPIFSASSCSYRIEAYWAYEICHGHHVKQYHEEREGKSIRAQEYYLGKWDSSKTKKLLQEQTMGSKRKYTKIDNVKYPYLEIEMTNGTLCDINNEPRVTRVRYVCYPHGKNEIYSLKETSTCNYEAIVLTSVLCMHSSFLPEDSDENMISCFPIGKSPIRPYSWLLNEVENLASGQKHMIDMFNRKENYAILKLDSKFAEVNVHEKSHEDGSENYNPPKLVPKLAVKQGHVSLDTSPVNEFLQGKNCLTGGTGWWRYEFCYGRQVRQFHVDKKGETSLILGFFDEELHKEWLKSNPEKRPKSKNMRTDVSHLYQGGTICDKTGEKRQTEVKLKCMDNTSSLSTVSMYLLEPKTCQYILVIESPLICDILKLVDEDGLVTKQTAENTIQSKYITREHSEITRLERENV